LMESIEYLTTKGMHVKYQPKHEIDSKLTNDFG